MKQKATVWALRDAGKIERPFLEAGGCWLAPWIFATREEARRKGLFYRGHGFNLTPVRIEISIDVKELD